MGAVGADGAPVPLGSSAAPTASGLRLSAFHHGPHARREQGTDCQGGHKS